MEDEEVGVRLVMVDQLHPDLVLAVREGAEHVVLAVVTVVGVVSAELSLILLEAVKLLDFVVALVAVVSFGALEIVVLVLDELSKRWGTFWATWQRSLVRGIRGLLRSLLEW